MDSGDEPRRADRPPSGKGIPNPFWHYGIWVVAIAAFGVYWALSLSSRQPELTYSAFKQAVQEVSERIEALLGANRDVLDRLATRLLEAETVGREELCRILESRSAATSAGAA